MEVEIKEVEQNKKIQIKILGMYGSSEIVCKDFGIMCSDKDTYSWNNLQLTWTDDSSKIDYYVIINNLAFGDNSYYDPKKQFFFKWNR